MKKQKRAISSATLQRNKEITAKFIELRKQGQSVGEAVDNLHTLYPDLYFTTIHNIVYAHGGGDCNKIKNKYIQCDIDGKGIDIYTANKFRQILLNIKSCKLLNIEILDMTATEYKKAKELLTK